MTFFSTLSVISRFPSTAIKCKFLYLLNLLGNDVEAGHASLETLISYFKPVNVNRKAVWLLTPTKIHLRISDLTYDKNLALLCNLNPSSFG